MDTEDAIAAELRDAQAAVRTIPAIRRRRQAAVMAALDAGLTKYRIAQVLAVTGPTVDRIIHAARKEGS